MRGEWPLPSARDTYTIHVVRLFPTSSLPRIFALAQVGESLEKGYTHVCTLYRGLIPMTLCSGRLPCAVCIILQFHVGALWFIPLVEQPRVHTCARTTHTNPTCSHNDKTESSMVSVAWAQARIVPRLNHSSLRPSSCLLTVKCMQDQSS